MSLQTGIDPGLPDGPGYVYLAGAATALRRARAAVVWWGDLGLRQEALGFIGILEDEEVSGPAAPSAEEGRLSLLPARHRSLLRPTSRRLTATRSRTLIGC